MSRSNANIGRYSITELYFYDVTNNNFFGANVELLAASDGNCILQLTISDDKQELCNKEISRYCSN